MENIRGVFLDMSEVPDKLSFDVNIFSSMCNLLYLRIYSSAFIKEGKAYINIDIPMELKLPLDEMRCLHWLKFPLEKLPSDFNAMNLVNLELPYSSIKQLWEGVKVCLIVFQNSSLLVIYVKQELKLGLNSSSSSSL